MRAQQSGGFTQYLASSSTEALLRISYVSFWLNCINIRNANSIRRRNTKNCIFDCFLFIFLFYTIYMSFELSDNKKLRKIVFVSILALVIAYSLDQYYIYKKELYFLSRPIQIINSLFR